MKTVYKYLLVALIASGTVFHSCETIELEDTVTPNALSPDQSDPNLLLNAIQIGYINNIQTMNDVSSSLTRIDYMFGRDYTTVFTSGTFNASWTRFYSSFNTAGMGTNIQNIQLLFDNPDTTQDLNYHLGVSYALQAHQLMLLVDFLGDVPWSEAIQPNDFPNPNLDNDATVYTNALTILDDAAAFLATADANGTSVNDYYYGGDVSKWIKLVNTLKMRHALTTGDTGAFNAIAGNPDNYISENADDFQWTFGTQQLNPDTRHQDYIGDYTVSGANIYQSNWLMSTMQGDDQSSPSDNDPRMRYYFFRQTDCTPGASCDPAGNGEVLTCSLFDNPPTHYRPFDPFCSLEEGYFGRDHGNDEGTPPDNFLRTAVGVYPAAGLFDDDRFSGLTLGAGGEGAGIEPIILASYVDFWRAEVALQSGNSGAAAALVISGITKSIDKVSSFGTVDPTADTSYFIGGDDYDNADPVDFANAQGARITGTGDDSWNALAENYFVTMYGGGSDAYNFYRRTGYPTTVQPSVEPNPGPFPQILYYPSNEVGTNPNVSQRTDLTERVFWNADDPVPPTQ